MSCMDQVLNFLNTHIERVCERAVTLCLITHNYLLQAKGRAVTGKNAHSEAEKLTLK